jgi:hypothetical protein
MVAGLAGSTVKLVFFPGVMDLYFFPIILGVSFVGCLVGSLCHAPDDVETLKSFYRNVRPWGFWRPIHKLVVAETPGFEGNRDFARDAFNVVVGIVWQMSLVVAPIYFVIHRLDALWITLGILAVTTLILKFTWYDHLKTVDREFEKNS